jgi:hypothetical protein
MITSVCTVEDGLRVDRNWQKRISFLYCLSSWIKGFFSARPAGRPFLRTGCPFNRQSSLRIRAPPRLYYYPRINLCSSHLLPSTSSSSPSPSCKHTITRTMASALRLGSSALRSSLTAPAFNARTAAFNGLRCYSSKTQVELPPLFFPAPSAS